MKYFAINKPKKALANIWDIDITDPQDGINFIEAICKLDLNDENISLNEIANDSSNHKRQRRNALHDIWNKQNYQ